jgi:hypothetical protein
MVTTTHGQHLVMGSSSPGDADGGPVTPFLRQSTPSPLQERRNGHPPETQRASGKARRYRYGYEGRVLASKPRPLLNTWYLPLCQ